MIIFMKRFVCIMALIAIFCLMLSACGANITTHVDSSPSTSEAPVSTSNTPVPTPDVNGEDIGGDEPVCYIDSLDEYRQHLKTEKLPSDFVDYDCLSKLGKFVRHGYYPSYDELDYWYNIDTGDQVIWFWVHPISRRPLRTPTTTLPPTVKDLTSIKEVCDIQIGSAVYSYVKGGLLSIELTDGVHIYVIHEDNFQFVSTDRSFVGRLLNRDTAEAAIEELKKDIASRGQ